MMRRFSGRMLGQQYLGNTGAKEVHDLDNEQPLCQIDEIMRAGHETPFDSLPAARAAGFDNCFWCLYSSRH
jgi:hypothetical protein